MSNQKAGKKKLTAAQKQESAARADYFRDMGRVFQTPIVRFLQSLPTRSRYRAAVLGGRALNAYLKPQYWLESPDWDINVWDDSLESCSLDRETPPDERRGSPPENEDARDAFGEALAAELRGAARGQAARLAVLAARHRCELTDITYEIAAKPFVTAWGASARVAHVNLVTTRFRTLALVDVVGSSRRGEVTAFDGVWFLDLPLAVGDLETVLGVPDYKKRARGLEKLRLFHDAVRRGGLACDYLKAVALGRARAFLPVTEADAQAAAEIDAAGGTAEPDLPPTVPAALRVCTSDTLVGPPDPDLDDALAAATDAPLPTRERVVGVSAADIAAHDEYVRSLPVAVRAALWDYTDLGSARVNLELLRRALLGPESSEAPVPAQARAIQAAIANAPPLRRPATLFRVARFVPLPGAPGGSDYDLNPGDVERQPTFLSATYDSFADLGPFLDEFAPCCAFVLTVPAGARVLVLGRNSVHPEESEVLLPIGTRLSVDERGFGNVTYRGVAPGYRGEIYYATLAAYRCAVLPPEEGFALGAGEPEVPAFMEVASLRRAGQLEKLAASEPKLHELLEMLLALQPD